MIRVLSLASGGCSVELVWLPSKRKCWVILSMFHIETGSTALNFLIHFRETIIQSQSFLGLCSHSATAIIFSPGQSNISSSSSYPTHLIKPLPPFDSRAVHLVCRPSSPLSFNPYGPLCSFSSRHLPCTAPLSTFPRQRIPH